MRPQSGPLDKITGKRRPQDDAGAAAKNDQPVGQGTRTLVIGPYLAARRGAQPEGDEARARLRTPEARLDEAVGLAGAIELTVVAAMIVTLASPRPATFLGKGWVSEFAALIKAQDIALVLMDCALSPVQQRNLEREWGAKVIDRTGLILEIFGRRARSREGTLQVELAHLGYQKSRLVRSWTHLERQRGGFGFLGGPGETQIEADRRVITERILRIERELEGVKRTRALHRDSRRKVPYPVVALVGYTNAGKSTLFNRLTRAGVLAQDMLFATLDPTARVVKLPHGARVIVSDTVGFISDLPTALIAAFRATLEDVLAADIILHVRDVAHGDTDAQSADVTMILRDLGVDPGDHRRLIEVWNKSDLLDAGQRQRLLNLAALPAEDARPVLVSAASGEGIDALLAAIEGRLTAERPVFHLTLESADGASLHWLYREAEVLDRRAEADGRAQLAIRIAPEKEPRLLHRFPGARRMR